VCVSCMTAAVTGVEMTTITLGSNATSSLARAFIASTEPPAHRFSIRTLRPSVHPNACSPWTSAALFRSPSESPATSDRNMATRGRRAACCARAASGHAADAPPSSVINARRLTCSPQSQPSRTDYSRSGSCIAAKVDHSCPVRVNRFGSIRPRCTRNVRFCSNSVQTLAAQRNDALCQIRTHAPQQSISPTRSPRRPAPAALLERRG
jgi:hypothetical protein